MLTHNFGSIEWSMANRLTAVRQVHVEDGFGPEERERQMPRRVWLRRLFLSGRTIALPSQTLMRIALEVWRLPARRLHYVPNGIDLGRFGGPRTVGPWPGQAPVVGTVAALRPEKNIARLIRAFALANAKSSARLVLIGDGPERPALEALTDMLGLRDQVIFCGHVAQPAALIRAFDVFAMSSVTEQMPISLLEAMAAGLPVAATKVGDIAAMLPEQQHSLVVAQDDASLAGAIAALLADPAQREQLGAANRRRAESDFDEQTMFERWTALLR